MKANPFRREPQGLSEQDIALVRQAFQVEFNQRPPTIAIIGVSGTGKSSTINAIFKTSLDISHTRACTKEFLATDLRMKVLKGPVQNEPVSLVVVDAPGLGEDLRADPSYIEQYRERLPDCDVILWVMAARNRAVSLDQLYLKQLTEFHERIVFGVNQIDIVHPMNWEDRVNLPSEEMEHNIIEIAEDRAQRIGDIIGRQPAVVPFSAARGYNLEQLFNCLITSAPPTRRFVFDLLKNFSYRDFVPQAIQHLI